MATELFIQVEDEETVIKLALDVGLLNYIDNETPRHYFIDGNAGLEEVHDFARAIEAKLKEKNA